jgi:ABC-type phosphate transport system ATPase subunit
VQDADLGGVHGVFGGRMGLLEVTGLNTYYGDSHILFDVALRVERNEVVALLGRNGAGQVACGFGLAMRKGKGTSRATGRCRSEAHR